MTTQYAWAISSLDVAPSTGGLSNVITAAHWRCSADNGVVSAEVYRQCPLALPIPESFTPYEDVTEAEVIAWVMAGLGEDGMESLVSVLDEMLENQMAPKVIVTPGPWVEPLPDSGEAP